MKRIDTYITEKQQQQLKLISSVTGLTVAELIRRAIDAYLERGKT